jgi:integrase
VLAKLSWRIEEVAMARVREHGKKWQVLYRDRASGREVSAGVFIRKDDANKLKRQIEYELEAGTWIDPRLRRTPYRDWVDEWMPTRSHLTPKTRAGYESLLRTHVLPRFGETRLQDIRTIDVEVWIAGLVQSGLSASGVRQAHSVLGSTLKAAVRSRMIPSNPAEGVALPRIEHREMAFLSPDEVQRLATVADTFAPGASTLILTLAYCGLRAGEAAALRRSRVNIVRSELIVAESCSEVHGELVFGPTKSKKRRTVAVPGFLRNALDDHLMNRTNPEPEALVFTSPDGAPLRLSNFRSRTWRRAVVAAGLWPSLRIHDLRHTAAAMLISQGAHPKLVQELLGHSSITVTMDRYGHLYPSERTKVADALDELYRTAEAAG